MLGVDLIKISRMERFIKRYQRKALERFLQDDEIDLVKNPKTAAGFWALKEACSKALGVGIGAECSFFDIVIGKTAKGAPTITLSPKVKNKFKIKAASASISHDGEYAIAVVALSTTDKI